MFKIKKKIAKFFYFFKISNLLLKIINKIYRNQYIRIVNYHDTFEKNTKNFIKQINLYKNNYTIINYNQLKRFLAGELKLDKPGLLITFDDGLKGNYKTAKKVLEKLNIGAIFFISAQKIGLDNYMSKDEIIKLLRNPLFSIGCHTATHHRMNKLDNENILNFEIIESKKELEQMFNINIESFCWCGGELETYTQNAYKKIKNNYEYCFTTNSKIVLKNENKMWLERINIEDNWDISLVMFQICGLMDIKYIKKRKIIKQRLERDNDKNKI